MVAIASCLLTIGGIVFYLGKMASGFERMQRDLNNLGAKVDHQNHECEQRFDKLDARADHQATFLARVDQRVIYIEERVFGEDTIARIRQLDT